MHVCLTCFSVFKTELISNVAQGLAEQARVGNEQHASIPCPTSGCGGQVVQLDEMLVPVIFILHYKGYRTTASCSGHVSQQMTETYIRFEPGVELPELPQGFELTGPNAPEAEQALNQEAITISKSHVSSDRVGTVLLANKKLYDWARSLPNLNEEQAEEWSEIEQRQNELLIMKMLAMGFSPFKQNIPPLIRKKAK